MTTIFLIILVGTIAYLVGQYVDMVLEVIGFNEWMATNGL